MKSRVMFVLALVVGVVLGFSLPARATKPVNDQAPHVESYTDESGTAGNQYNSGPYFKGAACWDATNSTMRPMACNASGVVTTGTGGGATSMTVTETLVLTSATPTPAAGLAGRIGISIQNLGPNPIFCSGGTPVVNKAHRVDPFASVYFPVTDAVVMSCIAATANQLTTAATVTTEIK